MSDPRVYFAAERTLLAWVRTGLGVMALGFVVERFGLFLALFGAQAVAPPAMSHRFSTAIGVALALSGAAVIAYAAGQHARYVRTLPAADLPPGYRTGFAPSFAVVIAAIGAALAVYLAFG
jgi:putative membrane protein